MQPLADFINSIKSLFSSSIPSTLLEESRCGAIALPCPDESRQDFLRGAARRGSGRAGQCKSHRRRARCSPHGLRHVTVPLKRILAAVVRELCFFHFLPNNKFMTACSDLPGRCPSAADHIEAQSAVPDGSAEAAETAVASAWRLADTDLLAGRSAAAWSGIPSGWA